MVNKSTDVQESELSETRELKNSMSVLLKI